MANRFAQQKPDKALKKNVIRARRSAQGARYAQSFVVAGSLAATLTGWALFSHQDAQIAASASQAAATPLAASVLQGASSSPTPPVTGVQVSTSQSAAANAGAASLAVTR